MPSEKSLSEKATVYNPNKAIFNKGKTRKTIKYQWLPKLRREVNRWDTEDSRGQRDYSESTMVDAGHYILDQMHVVYNK